MEFDYEAIEPCPHCGEENVYPGWDVERDGYIAVCAGCGKLIFLCDECMHSEDNPCMDCDWHECGAYNECMRGRIMNTDDEREVL